LHHLDQVSTGNLRDNRAPNVIDAVLPRRYTTPSPKTIPILPLNRTNSPRTTTDQPPIWRWKRRSLDLHE